MLQVEVGPFVGTITGLVIALAGGLAGFAKLLGGQINKRLDDKFDALERTRDAADAALRESLGRQSQQLERTVLQVETLERDFLKWQAELPIHYVRREDYIRGQSVIEAKLDALYNKLEVVQLKGATNDR